MKKLKTLYSAIKNIQIMKDTRSKHFVYLYREENYIDLQIGIYVFYTSI